MTKFSIGYNHSGDFIDAIHLLDSHVSEIYFQAPGDISGSGRVIFEEKDYRKNIERIIHECKKSGIKSNLLLNATCLGKDAGEESKVQEIVSYVKSLKEMGLDSVTVTNPIFIQKIKNEVPEIEVHSSVNCYVKSVEHAKYLRDLGADVITIDRDINRDIKLVEKIKEATGAKIKLLLNEGCIRNCPFRHVHFNMISHGEDSGYFDANSCVTLYKMSQKTVFKIPFIRPEDLKHYKGVADIFKLSTRTTPTIKIVYILDAYKNESYKGNLLNLLSTRGLFSYFKKIDNKVLNEEKFFEKLSTCGNDCDSCSYCDDLMEKAAERV